MNYEIPGTDQLRNLLGRMTHQDLLALHKRTGVHWRTLWKIRSGETPNPRVGTVRAFLRDAVEMAGEKDVA